ncbi:MAG TPA: lipocalin family protein [Tepidisphaeraceae bacterium]|nr:lipocalin family protein [Tepidisphaeraceae bacterium]
MSPTATISAVVVALLFFAWLFQSDVKDQAYEDYIKRQAAEAKEGGAAMKPIPNGLGIAVTDPGVTKHKPGGGTAAGSRWPNDPPDGGVLTGATLGPSGEDPFKEPAEKIAAGTFGSNARLNGTFVGVAGVGEAVSTTANEAEDPQITFRRDGTFATQNMALAEVDMEAATTVTSAAIDRGSGRYKLSGNTLELTYSDGLARKKGNKRSYTVVPVAGPDHAPVMITIQGKVFRVDPRR